MNEAGNQHTIDLGGLPPTAIKQCCAAAYESDAVKLLLGDSLHPGGAEMTDRLGRMLIWARERASSTLPPAVEQAR